MILKNIKIKKTLITPLPVNMPSILPLGLVLMQKVLGVKYYNTFVCI